MIVLDASALLAVIKGERGWESVAARTNGAVISVVNLAEVMHKIVDAGLDPASVSAQIAGLGVTALPASEAQAIRVGSWALPARQFGLSYADRFAAALAEDLSGELLTGDTDLTRLKCGARISKFR